MELTQREQQVASLVKEGRTSKEIGARLGISARTVGIHRSNILLKLGMRRSKFAQELLMKARLEQLG